MRTTDKPESIGPPPWRAIQTVVSPCRSSTLVGDDERGPGRGDPVEVYDLAPGTLDGPPSEAVAQARAERLWQKAEPWIGPGDPESRRRAREEARAAEAARPKKSREQVLAERAHYEAVAEGRTGGVLDARGQFLLTVSHYDISEHFDPAVYG